jgi:hypothetical protein
VQFGAALVAGAQLAEVVQPGKGALDNPSQPAAAGAVLGRAAGDDRLDPAAPQLAAVLVVVVATVGDAPSCLLTAPSETASNRAGARDLAGDAGDHCPGADDDRPRAASALSRVREATLAPQDGRKDNASFCHDRSGADGSRTGVAVLRGLSDGLTVAVRADAVGSATVSGVLDELRRDG